MCVSDGAPAKPGDKQKGMQALWDLFKANNAVFLADSGFNDALDDFLKTNKIARGTATSEQKKYQDIIKKALAVPSVV